MPKENEEKRKYCQKYTKSWETDPELKDWLSPDVTNETLATCKYCRIVLKAHKKDLLRHAKTEKHKKAVSLEKSAKSCRLISKIYKAEISDKTKISEIKIAAFIAEHTAVLTVDHLIELLPKLDPSSDALKNIRLHRTKCSMIIKNVLGPSLLKQLIEEIGQSPYSIIIDESTDLSTQKVLCIMVRFYSFEKRQIVTTFYRLIKLIECDAKTVYDAITNQLKKDGLKIENIVGIGVDGANVMTGKHNSVTALLKREIPDLIIVKCVSHSLHLCAENATKLLPRQLEFLVRESHNWFSYSPKRLETYRDLFEVMNNSRTPKKIQGLSGTRWLARYEAIITILEQWEELQLLFSFAKSEDKCYMAEQLYEIMTRKPYKALLIFLKNELKNVIQLNLLFQSDNVEPTKLFEDLFLLYKNLLKKLVVPSQLERLTESEFVDFDFKQHLVHTTSIYFGYDFMSISQELEERDLLDVRERCKNFLICLAQEIQKRLPENFTTLKMIADLHPKVATSQVKPDISKMLTHIQRIHIYGNRNDIESEWTRLNYKQWSDTSTSAAFYSEVYDDCDAGGHKRFENISKFALALMTVPISNASVERAFSIYNIVKNKLRNRLSLDMLQSLMMTRFSLKRDGGSCVTFDPSPKMLQLYNVNMYDFKKQETSNETPSQDLNDLLKIIDTEYLNIGQ